MRAMTIVIDMEVSKLSFEIACIPEQRLIQILPVNGFDQSLDKGMCRGT